MARRAAKAATSSVAEIPPPLELACLSVLWRLGEAAVGDVQEALHPTRPLAYTTIMTVLERLARKGMVTRRKEGRSFRYSPAHSREEMRLRAVALLVQQFFDDSIPDLQRFLLTAPSLSLPPSQGSVENHPRAAEQGQPAPDRHPFSLDASLL